MFGKTLKRKQRIKMNSYIEHDVVALERLENRFIKLALLARGSKRLFSNCQKAERYLEKMEEKSFSFPSCGRLPCKVEKKKILDTEYVVFEPNGGAKTKKSVFYLHGGAYVRHITKLHLKTVARLCAESGVRFVVPAYLTAPKYGFSTSAEQLLAIFEKEIKKDETAILAGDSCGCAIAVCLLPKLEKRGLTQVEKLLLFSPLLCHDIDNCKRTKVLSKTDPMFGGTEGLRLFLESWCRNEKCADPMSIDFSLLKRTYIFTSKGDMLHVGCLDFFEKAKAGGANVLLEIWNEMFHDFVLYPLLSSKALLKRARKIINE